MGAIWDLRWDRIAISRRKKIKKTVTKKNKRTVRGRWHGCDLQLARIPKKNKKKTVCNRCLMVLQLKLSFQQSVDIQVISVSRT